MRLLLLQIGLQIRIAPDNGSPLRGQRTFCHAYVPSNSNAEFPGQLPQIGLSFRRKWPTTKTSNRRGNLLYLGVGGRRHRAILRDVNPSFDTVHTRSRKDLCRCSTAMGIRAISSYSPQGIVPRLDLSRSNAKPFPRSRLQRFDSATPRSTIWQEPCVTHSMNIRQNSRVDEKQWRKLCEMVIAEPDPQRLSELIDQLLNELDARRQSLRGIETGSSSTSDYT